MGFNDTHSLNALPDYLTPAVGVDGVWGSVGGIALRASLQRGSAESVIGLLKSMDARGVAGSLRDAGFAVAPDLVAQGRGAVFASVQKELSSALDLRVDGYGLAGARGRRSAIAEPVVRSFAAKDVPSNFPSAGVISDAVADVDFSAREFGGDLDAARQIQDLMRSETLAVDLLGVADAGKRGALLLVAGQALRQGVQGFGFEGVAGKYQVPLSMATVLELHREAAVAVAEASARVGLGVWAAGNKVQGLSGWVPDSVQRLLHGSVSLAAAQAVVQAIEDGSVGHQASEIGDHAFTALLAAQGFNVNAPTIERQADELGLVMHKPNRMRGQYFGAVIGADHRAALVKDTRTTAIDLPFAELAEGQAKPMVGDNVAVVFKVGIMTMTVQERLGREAAGR